MKNTIENHNLIESRPGSRFPQPEQIDGNPTVKESLTVANIKAWQDRVSDLRHEENVAMRDEIYALRTTLSDKPVAQPVAGSLEQEIINLHARLAGETLRANTGWKRYEAANQRANDVEAALAQSPNAQPVPASIAWPEKCPITRLPLFMEIDGEPTYGGPFDSYTIPTMEGDLTDQFHERELTRKHFDHDRGHWVDDESVNMRVINEDVLFDLQEATEKQASINQAQPVLTDVQISKIGEKHSTASTYTREFTEDGFITAARAIIAATSAQQYGDAKDAELLRSLIVDNNPIDTIHFDNGEIIDVGGKYSGDLRSAIYAAMKGSV